MGLAILFVTLNFVSATLSIKVYSSNSNSSEGIGLQNDESGYEDPTNIDEKTLKKDTNLIDFLDCLYGDHRYKYPNLTESIAKSRFDESLHQKSYEKILNSHVIKSSTNNEQFTGCQNNDKEKLFDFNSSDDETSSSSLNYSYDDDLSCNDSHQAPDIPPPPAGLFERTNGSPSKAKSRSSYGSHCSPKAISTYHFYSPGATDGNEADDFPSVLYFTNKHFSYPPDTK